MWKESSALSRGTVEAPPRHDAQTNNDHLEAPLGIPTTSFAVIILYRLLRNTLQHVSKLRISVAHVQLLLVTCDTVKAVVSLSTGSHLVLVVTVGDSKQGQCKAEQHQTEEDRVAFVVLRRTSGEIGPSVIMSVSSAN